MDVLQGPSGVVALNATHLIARSDKANAQSSDGVEASQHRYLRRGEKTSSKVAKLFPMDLVKTVDTSRSIVDPFSIVAFAAGRHLCVSDSYRPSVQIDRLQL